MPLRFLTILVIGGTLAVLFAVHWLLRRSLASAGWLVLVAAMLCAAVVIPPEGRSLLFVVTGVLIGLLATEGKQKIWGALVSGGFMWCIEALVPGGTSALILALLAIFGGISLRTSYQHLTRLRRARRLVPGEKATRDVEITGSVVGEDRRIDGTDILAAAWSWGKLSSPYLQVQTEFGPAFVELADAHISAEERILSEEEKRAILENEKRQQPPQMKQAPSHSTMHVFRNGAAVYAVGIPDWDAPPFGGPGYRDADVVPVFRMRSSSSPPVFVANRSELELRRESWWTIATWAGWGIVCAWVALLQAFWGL